MLLFWCRRHPAIVEAPQRYNFPAKWMLLHKNSFWGKEIWHTALSFKNANTAFDLNALEYACFASFAFLCGMKRRKKSASPKKNAPTENDGRNCLGDFLHFM